MDVILATASRLPRPDEDDGPLRQALAARGVRAETRPWDDPGVEWAAARAVVIRSTWNYVQAPEAFSAWAERCGQVTALWNPWPVVRWNLHKSYLVALGGAGLAVVPTRLVPRGEKTSLADICREWTEVVIKPAVSAGSFGTLRVGPSQLGEGQRHLDTVGALRDMLVQPYQRSVEDYGERSLVWVDGVFTHAVRKAARFAGEAQRVSEAVPIADDERALAERIMAAAPGPLLYGRVDLARDEAGSPQLMELELIEPSLFLDRAPWACARLAAAIARGL